MWREWSALRKLIWLRALLAKAVAYIWAVVSGEAPLSLSQSLAKPLKSLTQRGKCVLRDPDAPDGWARVEFLRSSGDAYLDLGYKGGQNTKVKVRYRYHTETSASGSGRVLGSRIGSASDAFAIGTSSGVVAATGNKVFWCYDSQPYFVVDDPKIALDEWVEVVLSATEHTVNGVSYGDDYTPTAFETPSNLTLFGFDNNGSMGVGYADISACQLWDGNTLLRDLTPVYDGTEYAMYDNVSGALLHNAGTGAFSGGAAVTPSLEHPADIVCNNGVLKARHQSGLPTGYQLCEYIEANNGPFITTSVKLASTDVVETEFANLSATGYGGLYGVYETGNSSAFYANQTYYGYDAVNNKVNTGVSVDTEWHTVAHDFVNGKLTFDGVDTAFTPFTFANENETALFARYYGSSYGYFFRGKVRKFKVTRNGVVICNLLPVKRVSDDALGFYDLSTDVFYTNDGTDNFTAGSSVTDPIEIYADGTPEVLTVRGKNLFNPAAVVNGYEIINTRIHPASGWWVSDYIPVNGGEPYTFTSSGARNGAAIFFCKTIGTTEVIAGESMMIDGVVPTSAGSSTYTIPAGYNFLVINGKISNTADIQIEEGSTATDYEPYQEPQTATVENLLSSERFVDTQEIIAGLKIPKVRAVVFDGTEDIKRSSSNPNKLYWQVPRDGRQAFTNTAVFCSHFKPAATATWAGLQVGECLFEGNDSGNYSFDFYTDNVDRDTFKTRLAELYAAGTPVFMLVPNWDYWDHGQVPDQVTPQPLHSYNGTTIIDVESNVGPVVLEAEFAQAQ